MCNWLFYSFGIRESYFVGRFVPFPVLNDFSNVLTNKNKRRTNKDQEENKNNQYNYNKRIMKSIKRIYTIIVDC